MVTITPSKRPQLSRTAVEFRLHKAGITAAVALVGLRGYYLNTMGEVGKNDRGIYDDAIFLVSPTFYATYNANVDPNIYKRGVAVLKEGTWWYQKGKHRLLYDALRQAAPVTVVRDETGDDTGWFGINIHKGSYTKTSSLGCQTIYPDQWKSFITSVYSEMDKYNQPIIPYILGSE